MSKKRRISEDIEEEAHKSEEETLAVNFIKKKCEYEACLVKYDADVPVPPCETFLAMHDKLDKYKTFSRVLKINTSKVLSEIDPDILTFLFQLYFVIFKHGESSLKILLDITRVLEICVENSSDVITEDDLFKWVNDVDTKSETDQFVEIYQIIMDVVKRVSSINFPSNVKFTSLGTPFLSSTFNSRAVRVSFDKLIGPFAVNIGKMPIAPGSKQTKTFITRKMKSQKFIDELSKYIEHGETNIEDVIWRDIDIGISNQQAENDGTREVVVHQQVGTFDIIKTESFAVLKDILIYKNIKANQPAATKFNLRAYTKKTLTFNYDAKLLEEYNEFVGSQKLS